MVATMRIVATSRGSRSAPFGRRGRGELAGRWHSTWQAQPGSARRQRPLMLDSAPGQGLVERSRTALPELRTAALERAVTADLALRPYPPQDLENYRDEILTR